MLKKHRSIVERIKRKGSVVVGHRTLNCIPLAELASLMPDQMTWTSDLPVSECQIQDSKSKLGIPSAAMVFRCNEDAFWTKFIIPQHHGTLEQRFAETFHYVLYCSTLSHLSVLYPICPPFRLARPYVRPGLPQALLTLPDKYQARQESVHQQPKRVIDVSLILTPYAVVVIVVENDNIQRAG
jgi:hypothetical protein